MKNEKKNVGVPVWLFALAATLCQEAGVSSPEVLAPAQILELAVRGVEQVTSSVNFKRTKHFLDLFNGKGWVGHFVKKKGKAVHFFDQRYVVLFSNHNRAFPVTTNK